MATEGILGCVSLLKSKIRSKIWMIRIFLEKRHGIKKRDYFSHNIEGILEKKKQGQCCKFQCYSGRGKMTELNIQIKPGIKAKPPFIYLGPAYKEGG